MSDTIVFQTLLFAWPDSQTASQVSKDIRYNHLLRGLTITDHAVIRHEAGGKIRVDSRNRSRLGAAIGAAVGGAAGIIAGPIGIAVLAGVGGGVGAWLGRDVGRPVAGAELGSLARELPPGSSAILLLVGARDVDAVISALKPFDPQIANLTAGQVVDGIVIGDSMKIRDSSDTKL